MNSRSGLSVALLAFGMILIVVNAANYIARLAMLPIVLPQVSPVFGIAFFAVGAALAKIRQ